MEKMKKVTKRENFTAIKNILDGLGRTDLVAVMEHELELLAKKNSADRKPTKAQEENNGIKDVILEMLASEPDRLFTITEIQKANESLAELSNQKLSALIRQLKEDNKVERVEDKRKAYFKIA